MIIEFIHKILDVFLKFFMFFPVYHFSKTGEIVVDENRKILDLK